MSWDDQFEAGPKDEALTALGPYIDWMRIPEVSAGARPRGVTEQYRHGARDTGRTWSAPLTFSVELGVAQGASAAEAVENLSTLKRILCDTRKLVTLQRVRPFHGTAQIDVRSIGQPSPSLDPVVFSFPFQAPDPFWRLTDTPHNGIDVTAGLTVGGDAPVGDAVVRIVGGTDVKVTHDQTGDWILIEGATPGTGVDVDMSGAVTQVADGSDYDAGFDAYRPWWIELIPGVTNTFTIAGGPSSVTATWLDKVR